MVNVTLRYVFHEGRIELEELQWHLNALAFLIAIAYAYRVDAHIRIDLVSVRLRPRIQVWIEFYSTLLLLLPFIAVVLWYSFPFVAHSWTVSEISSSPGGLPFRWLLKGVLPVAFLLLLVAVASRLTRCGRTSRTGRHDRRGSPGAPDDRRLHRARVLGLPRSLGCWAAWRVVFTAFAIVFQVDFAIPTSVDWFYTSMTVDRIWDVMENWVLVALPMFIFMGVLLDRSGIARSL